MLFILFIWYIITYYVVTSAPSDAVNPVTASIMKMIIPGAPSSTVHTVYIHICVLWKWEGETSRSVKPVHINNVKWILQVHPLALLIMFYLCINKCGVTGAPSDSINPVSIYIVKSMITGATNGAVNPVNIYCRNDNYRCTLWCF